MKRLREGCPLSMWNCSAIFRAPSIDSLPPLPKKTQSRPGGVISTSACASRSAGSVVK
jgi:hypothetical protein